jgi:hypothetical protein
MKKSGSGIRLSAYQVVATPLYPYTKLQLYNELNKLFTFFRSTEKELFLHLLFMAFLTLLTTDLDTPQIDEMSESLYFSHSIDIRQYLASTISSVFRMNNSFAPIL